MTVIKIAPSKTLSGATDEGTTRTLQQLDPVKAALAQERALRNAEAMARGAEASHNTGTDLRLIQFPEVEYYGQDHAVKTAQLAVHVAVWMRDAKFQGADQFKSSLTGDIAIIKAAALFHDLGRQEVWQKQDPGHALRSANLADAAIRAHAEYKNLGESFRADVCRLITQHSLAAASPPTDPRLIALWDAECYESARFAPGKPEGLERMRYAMGRVITPWASVTDHQRRWRVSRGWS